jgi:hypothetical protein
MSAVFVSAPVDFFEIEDVGVELDRPLEVRDSDADIADPQVGHGPVVDGSKEEAIGSPGYRSRLRGKITGPIIRVLFDG